MGRRIRWDSPENSKAGAQAYEAFLRREITIHGSLDHLRKKQVKISTFAEFVEHWVPNYVLINNKPSEQRSKEYILRNHLLPFFGKRNLDQIDSQLIEQFKRLQQAKKLHPKTINNQLTIIHRALVIAKEWGELAEVPKMRFLKAPQPSFRVIAVDDFERLLEHTSDPLWRTVMIVLAYTGLRFSELAGLRWDQVDLQDRQLCVRYAFVCGYWGTPKNGRVRYVSLIERVVSSLMQLERAGELVFQRNGKPLVYESVYSAIERSCKRAGLPRISPHVLRHTFASNIVSRGGGLQAVQELLGHATMTMTLRYAHLAQSVLRSAVGLLEEGADPDISGRQVGYGLKSSEYTLPPPSVILEEISLKKTKTPD